MLSEFRSESMILMSVFCCKACKPDGYKKRPGTMELAPADRQINAAAARTPRARSTSCFSPLTDCCTTELLLLH